MSTPTVIGFWKAGVQRRKRPCLSLRHDRLVGWLFIGGRLRLAPYDVEKLFRGRNLSIGGHAHLLVQKVPAVRNRSSLPEFRCPGNRMPRNPYRERVSRKCHRKSRMIINSYTRKENPLKSLSISFGLSSFFRQQQPTQQLHNMCHKTNTYPVNGTLAPRRPDLPVRRRWPAWPDGYGYPGREQGKRHCYKHFRRICMTGVLQICYGEKGPERKQRLSRQGWMAGLGVYKTGGAAMRQFSVKTQARSQMIDITAQVRSILRESRVESGACLVFVPHTTAAVTINENADPDVPRDILAQLDKTIPLRGDYLHSEGNSAATSRHHFSELRKRCSWRGKPRPRDLAVDLLLRIRRAQDPAGVRPDYSRGMKVHGCKGPRVQGLSLDPRPATLLPSPPSATMVGARVDLEGSQ